MSLNNLIQVAVILAVAAVSTGQLPLILREVRVAQLHLIKDSQASKWGKPLLLSRDK
ncbi:MAG: hypothetical protein IT288_18315 [Bdellovibrionales bacterium]|nr:hypothetical protein [Bdellovibrionales bacterium]